MDTLFLLMAAAITLMALNIGEQERRRGSRELRVIPLPALTRLPDERAGPAVVVARSLTADQWGDAGRPH